MFNSVKDDLMSRDHYPFSIERHKVLDGDLNDLKHYPHQIVFGLGCFWGAERLFWSLKGVILTAVGYAGGRTPFPSYDEVCTGATDHTEVVAIAYDPDQISLSELLRLFWESHDPTQGMRQGNDIGTQYRSAIYCKTDADMQAALESKAIYQGRLQAKGFPLITTEIARDIIFYFAEPYHQQYLHTNPNGYCGLKGTGVVCV